MHGFRSWPCRRRNTPPSHQLRRQQHCASAAYSVNLTASVQGRADAKPHGRRAVPVRVGRPAPDRGSGVLPLAPRSLAHSLTHARAWPSITARGLPSSPIPWRSIKGCAAMLQGTSMPLQLKKRQRCAEGEGGHETTRNGAVLRPRPNTSAAARGAPWTR